MCFCQFDFIISVAIVSPVPLDNPFTLSSTIAVCEEILSQSTYAQRSEDASNDELMDFNPTITSTAQPVGMIFIITISISVSIPIVLSSLCNTTGKTQYNAS